MTEKFVADVEVNLHVKPIVGSAQYADPPNASGPAPRAQPADPSYGHVASPGDPDFSREHFDSKGNSPAVELLLAFFIVALLAMLGLIWTSNRPEVITKTQDRFVPVPQVVIPQPRVDVPAQVAPAPRVNNPVKRQWVDDCVARGATIYTAEEWNRLTGANLPRGAMHCSAPARGVIGSGHRR